MDDRYVIIARRLSDGQRFGVMTSNYRHFLGPVRLAGATTMAFAKQQMQDFWEGKIHIYPEAGASEPMDPKEYSWRVERE